jgi:very-short-patch-repair endonuclease
MAPGVDGHAQSDPSPAGEGGSRAAADGWGGRRSEQTPTRARSLRRRLTPQEVKLWNWLREAIAPAGFPMRKQVPIDRFIVDFACLSRRLVIEVDGAQHGVEPVASADRIRDVRLAELGYRVLRFSNGQVDREKAVVLDTVYAALSGTDAHPHPSPSATPSPAGEGSSVGLPRLELKSK